MTRTNAALLMFALFSTLLTGFSAGRLHERLNQPRLIGFGCDGTRGPIWATEEDDFLAGCEEIRVWGRD